MFPLPLFFCFAKLLPPLVVPLRHPSEVFVFEKKFVALTIKKQKLSPKKCHISLTQVSLRLLATGSTMGFTGMAQVSTDTTQATTAAETSIAEMEGIS